MDSPSPHQPPPRRTPGLSAPRRKAGSRNPDAVLVNSGSVWITTARLLYIGRMLSASTVPPGSWPCRPSTIRRPVCRSQHPAGLSPLCRRPPGAGHVASCSARGSRAGERLQEEGRGRCPQDPPYCARDLEPPHSRSKRDGQGPTVILHANGHPRQSPGGRSSVSPARTFSSRAHRPFGLLPSLGSPLRGFAE